MKVAIIENSTRIVVSTSEINIQGMNYIPDENEHFSMAWDNAVEDGLVDSDRRSEYTIRRVND